jgi:hypothetical protein
MQDNAPTVIAVARDYLGLVAALRERCAELKMTYETLEAIAGLSTRHVNKLLAPEPTRSFGPMSFDAVLGALACKVALIDDPERRERILQQWQYRPRSFGRRVRSKKNGMPLSKEPAYIVWRVTNEHMRRMTMARAVKTTPEQRRDIARKAALARSPSERREIARKAARARWGGQQCEPAGD